MLKKVVLTVTLMALVMVSYHVAVAVHKSSQPKHHPAQEARDQAAQSDQPQIRNMRLEFNFMPGALDPEVIRRQEGAEFRIDGIAIGKNQAFAQITSKVFDVPVADADPFLGISASWQAESASVENIRIELRTSVDGTRWGKWRSLEPDQDAAPGQDQFFSKPVIVDKGVKFFRYRISMSRPDSTTTPTLRKLILNFVSPGATAPSTLDEINQEGEGMSIQSVSKPSIVSRVRWGCEDGSFSPDWPPVCTQVTHIIVHHSDTETTGNDWPAVVRYIWQQHARARGWGDIGYNYLIDPNGIIYQGRAYGDIQGQPCVDDVVGSHFTCANSNTLGISLIGNFDGVSPTGQALDSLKKLIAWKCEQRGINPIGIGIHFSSQLALWNVSGHRDVNDSTALNVLACRFPLPYTTICPGGRLYGMLPTIRWDVRAMTSGSCINTAIAADKWKGEYFNNTSLSGSPRLVRDDGGSGGLGFDWGYGGPGPTCGIGYDNFSARWTRSVNFAVGTQRFTVTADDGVRLYLDGRLILNKWFNQASTTYNVEVSVTAGNHTLKMEYYDSGADAVAKLSWQQVGSASPAPTLSSITPGTVTLNTPTWLDVSGSNFISPVRAFVTTPTGTWEVAAAGIQFIGGNLIKVQVNMAGSTSYGATLKVQNPDGQFDTRTFQVVPPAAAAPGLSGISPNQVTVNQSTGLTVSGSNFSSGFRAEVTTSAGTFPIATAGLTFVSSSQVKVQVTMSPTPTPPYTATLRIINPDNQSATGTFQVRPATSPAPAISSITPGTVVLNTPTWLTVNGSNFTNPVRAFVSTSSGTWEIASAGIQYVGASQVRVQVTMGGSTSYSVTLRIQNPDGQSASGGFNVVPAPTPAPVISSITPGTVMLNTPTWLTVNGSNFANPVRAFVSTSSGTWEIASAGIQYVGASQVRVQVTMGGSTSYSATLRIQNANGQSASGGFNVVPAPTPAPAISSITPGTVMLNTPTWLTVNGSNFANPVRAFVSTSSGTWEIASAGIQYVGAGQLRVQVTMGGSTSYSATLRIQNADGQSASGGFNVVPAPTPAPAISSITPGTVMLNTPTWLTVNGSNFTNPVRAFVSTSSGTWEIASAGIQYVGASQVRVQVTMGGSTSYSATLRIQNANGQSTSGGFQVMAPGPVISSITPSQVRVNQPTTMTVSGSNFQAGFSAAVITSAGTFPIAGAGLTFVSSSQVRVQVTMGGTPTYTATLRITNPDGQRSTATFQVVP